MESHIRHRNLAEKDTGSEFGAFGQGLHVPVSVLNVREAKALQ